MWDPLAPELKEIHVQELLSQAATERLARQGRAPGHSRLHKLTCRWLYGLGQFLVGLGQRLQRIGVPPAVTLEGRMSTGGAAGARR